MSSPTTRSFDTPGGRTSPEITDFVAAVRACLDDLSADEVTELTGGLEADLTDALAEAKSTPSDRYGNPAEYASELRAAAGLPPRGAGGARRAGGPGFAESLEQNFVVPVGEKIQSGLQSLDSKPWWPGVRDFLVVLRPAWWVIRAWVAVQSLLIVFNNDGGDDSAVRGGIGGLLLLLAVIVLSVQIGRNTPLPATWQRVTVAAWNVVAILLLLPVMFAGQQHNYYSDDRGYVEPPSGLNLGGEQVTNVFPYDSAGRPLTGVQLYDQNGRALEIAEGDRSVYDEQTGTSAELVPGSPPGSAPRWNAFPLQQRRSDADTGQLGPVEPAPLPLSGVPSMPAQPFPTVAPTGVATPIETPTPAMTPAPTSTNGATAPAPTPSRPAVSPSSGRPTIQPTRGPTSAP